MNKTKRPIGRPSIYTNEIADEICERIAKGESLRRVCQDEHLPSESTVYAWLTDNQQFSDKYARARERQADCFLDEMIEIADCADDESSLKIQKARLQIDTRKIVIEKLAPRKYGRNAETTPTENEKSAPVQVVFQVANARDDTHANVEHSAG